MSATHFWSTPTTGSPRWLLIGSLALNLFFIGAVAAMLLRSPSPPDRAVSARIERLAATLPEADAKILRGEFQANRTGVEGAQAAYETARNDIRAVLRREPFEPAAMSEAMAKTRAARQNFDLVLQGVVAKAAGEMSPAGRGRLADYRPPSRAQSRR